MGVGRWRVDCQAVLNVFNTFAGSVRRLGSVWCGCAQFRKEGCDNCHRGASEDLDTFAAQETTTEYAGYERQTHEFSQARTASRVRTVAWEALEPQYVAQGFVVGYIC